MPDRSVIRSAVMTEARACMPIVARRSALSGTGGMWHPVAGQA